MRRLVLAAFVSSLLGLAVAQAPVRCDAARFQLPSGWTQANGAAGLRLQSASGDAVVEVSRSVPVRGTIDDYGATLIAEASKLPEYRVEVEPSSGVHRASKGLWHRWVYSHAHPERPGQFRYVTVMTVASGARAQTFTMVNDTVAAYEANRVALGAMVDGVVMTSGQRLERGKPPLTRYMVDEVSDFLEWLVHAPLTEDQRGTVEAELRRYWREGEQTEIDGVQEVLAARGELAKLPEAERELARQAVLEQALAEWKKDEKSAGARMMLAIHDAANQPIAKGEPPLTRQAVEAFAEFLAFAAGRTVDLEMKLPQEQRDQLVAGIAEGYAELPAEQREQIAGMPMSWAALRVAWPAMSKEEQQACIASWRATESIAALGRSFAAQKKAEAEAAAAASRSDLASRQMVLQAQQASFQMMQNVMRMQSETARIMASNMGGNTSYVYRW